MADFIAFKSYLFFFLIDLVAINGNQKQRKDIDEYQRCEQSTNSVPSSQVFFFSPVLQTFLSFVDGQDVWHFNDKFPDFLISY